MIKLKSTQYMFNVRLSTHPHDTNLNNIQIKSGTSQFPPHKFLTSFSWGPLCGVVFLSPHGVIRLALIPQPKKKRLPHLRYTPKGLIKLQLGFLIVTYKPKIHLVSTQYETQYTPAQHILTQDKGEQPKI